MKVIGVIPARYASTRFPGKPLKKIAGKELLAWVIEDVLQSKKIDQVMVATDHLEIAKIAERYNIPAIMTDSDLATGSDRVWAAVQHMECDIVVNIQGDEPLITASVLDKLVAAFEQNPRAEMATLARSINEADLASPNTAKIVLNKNSEAIYFSRFAIPFSRLANASRSVCLKHIGIYAFKKTFLKEFCQCPPTDLEMAEGLEQLRALYLGAKIAVVEVDHDSWGVDTPDDVAKVEALLSKEK